MWAVMRNKESTLPGLMQGPYLYSVFILRLLGGNFPPLDLPPKVIGDLVTATLD